jgi:hypothetical protein
MSPELFTVYTAIFGRPEAMYRPPRYEYGVRWVCFTDQPVLKKYFWWETVLMDCPHDDPALGNRLLKCKPWLVIPNGDTVYCDPTIQWRRCPSRLGPRTVPLVATPHPGRDIVREEIGRCTVGRMISRNKAIQIARMVDLNMPLPLCSAFWRWDCDEVRRFGEEWWRLVSTVAGRDQLFFCYAAKVAGCPYAILHASKYFRQHKHFRFRDMHVTGVHNRLWA